MLYGGIDPGNQGAFVLLDHRMMVVSQHEMPLINVGTAAKNKWVLDVRAVDAILAGWVAAADDRQAGLFVALEKAQVMAPGSGSSPASARSMFGYGRAFGAMEGILTARAIAHELIHPLTWGRAILKGVEGRDTKARAILRVSRAIPSLDLTPGRKRKPHDGLADAACLAMYASTLRPVPGVPPVLSEVPSRSSVDPRLPPGPPPARED